jgi:hypothetical protein
MDPLTEDDRGMDSHRSASGLRVLRLDALEALGLVGDEAHVPAALAFLDWVVDRELERYPSFFDVDDPDVTARA